MQGPSLAIGIDEVGRGPLAGPVVACGVVLDTNKPIVGLRDSKKLTAKAREDLCERIKERALLVSIAEVDSLHIDKINILQASLYAMSQVLNDALQRLDISEAFIDGRDLVPTRLKIKQKAIIGGDSLVESIMAASIVAKVYRDKLMTDFDEIYPGYGFKQHKGYATEIHLSALAQLGPCAIHRRSFSPVSQARLL
jgi:ribonuclease HII